MVSVRQMVAVLVSGSLVLPPLAAQEAAKPAAGGTGEKLHIFVLQGNGAVNSIRERTVRQPVVEVRDEFNQPVRGADVVFQLPLGGPGGYFMGQKLGWSGKTDANGQAVAPGLVPNDTPGRYNIRVSATHGSRMGQAMVTQTNSLRPVPLEVPRRGRISGWWKAAAVIGAGAAAGGIVWGLRRGNGTPTVVLQPGTVSFGGPR